MCCLKIDTETLLANCLNTCKTYSFSPDDLQQVVRLMANATDRYIFSDTGDDALHEIVTKFPDMFVYADENRIALRSEWPASGSTMTRSCRWRISTLDTPPLTSSNCAPQRKNTAPRKMNSCQVVRTG